MIRMNSECASQLCDSKPTKRLPGHAYLPEPPPYVIESWVWTESYPSPASLMHPYFGYQITRRQIQNWQVHQTMVNAKAPLQNQAAKQPSEDGNGKPYWTPRRKQRGS